MSSNINVTTYIQGHDASTLASHQSRSAEAQADYLLKHIKLEHRVLDVGCGPGTISCDFARYASSGSVIGVDYSEEVLEQARKEASKRKLNNITFSTADAHALPFEDDHFDIVHCHALLVHVPNAAAVIKEMRRVCKKGGYVAAREPDWDTCVIHPYNEHLEKWKALQAQLKRREGSEPNAGRHLAEWAFAAGFALDQIQVTSNVLQYFGKHEVKWWGELYSARMKSEFGRRVKDSNLISAEELDQILLAYLEWSKSQTGIWAMMHMRLLCQK